VKYAVEMGSGVKIYIPKFHKNRFSHSKANGGGGGFTDTQTAWISHKPTLGNWAKSNRLNVYNCILFIWPVAYLTLSVVQTV
jgi:hypothetical protein